jgi:hypothetical protein
VGERTGYEALRGHRSSVLFNRTVRFVSGQHHKASKAGRTDLDETDILGLFSEALTADKEAVLANKTGSVGADAAAKDRLLAIWVYSIVKISSCAREVSLKSVSDYRIVASRYPIPSRSIYIRAYLLLSSRHATTPSIAGQTFNGKEWKLTRSGFPCHSCAAG